MGFPSFFEDIALRAAESGVDVAAFIRTYEPPCDDSGGDTSPSEKPRTTTLRGEEAKRFLLEHWVKPTWFATLVVLEAKTGRVLQEFPYRERKEVEARVAEFERQYPGVIHLRIAKRAEMPQKGSARIVALALEHGRDHTVTIRRGK